VSATLGVGRRPRDQDTRSATIRGQRVTKEPRRARRRDYHRAEQHEGTDAVDQTHLGRSGLSVSRLCLGTMNFGPHTDEADAHAIMDAAHDHGVNFFDTANVYGWRKGEGWTEQIIGRWFATGDGRRDRTVLATKLYGSMSDWPNDTFLSKRNIIRACEGSLRRLQTDWIDLYQMHHVDRNTPWDEIWEAMETLVAQGKVLYVGSSNHAGWHVVQGLEAARRRNFVGIVSEQSLYNLLERTVELEVLPACEAYGVGVIPWSPLAQGLLSGILRKEREGRSATERTRTQLERHRGAIERYEALCDDFGHDPAQVGLAWLCHQPAVTSPIVGPRTLQQFMSALEAFDIALDEAAMARLDEIFPGPGGPAPEAYAW
jgi:aryl-alcohol dehydrogenase-like predicted oxidoreductase